MQRYIRHQQFRTVLLQNLPLTITAFIQVYGSLEKNTDRAPEKNLDHLEARIDAHTQEMAELKRPIGKSQRFQPYLSRSSRPTDGERRCYQCNRLGHLKRDCSSITDKNPHVGNDNAGPVGQARL